MPALGTINRGTSIKKAEIMGEAKRRMEQIRASYLEELKRWQFPETEWEKRTIEEIRKLPVVVVTRYPDDTLAYMRMLPRQCHVNARFMQDNDPDGRLKQVTGWWIQDEQYVLHSVVDQYGQYVCVTPSPLHRESTFAFIPDAKIEWRDDGDYRTAYRDGIEIGPGVRANPAKVLAELEAIERRLRSGMNPFEAVRVQR